MNLIINNHLKELLPAFNVISYEISFNDDYDAMTKSDELTKDLNDLSKKCSQEYSYEQIPQITKLKETRDGYKTLGKDPSHTRPACEALLRRVVKGNELYRLGDVIDAGNILSIKTLRSVCVVDADKIDGDVEITIGSEGITYEGIGRGLINASNLIIYTDNQGIFGSPTSDTNRTKVTIDTKKIWIMIICFSDIDKDIDEKQLIDIYTKYTKINTIKKIIY